MGGTKKTAAPRTPPSPLAIALRILSYRDRTLRTMEEKLREKGLSSDEISRVIDKLQAEGLLDDERFARELAASRIRNRNWGPVKIRLDLQRKGVPGDITERVVSGLDKDLVEEAAKRAYQKWTLKKGLDPEACLERGDFIKACRHLESRGFPRGLIFTVIKGGGDI